MLLCGVLRKRLHLTAYRLFIIQCFEGVERWVVCTPLSVNVFVTLATQQRFQHNCKALFETLCIHILCCLLSCYTLKDNVLLQLTISSESINLMQSEQVSLDG
jgi:hypothetical protein